MRVKKFRNTNLPAVLESVKREMGPGAIILQTKKVRGSGLTGLIGRKWLVEVTAAIDEQASEARLIPSIAVKSSTTGGRVPVLDLQPALAERRAPAFTDAPISGGQTSAMETERVVGELQGLRDVLGCLWREMRERAKTAQTEVALYPEPIESLFRHLLMQEIEPALARHVADAILDEGVVEPNMTEARAISILARLTGSGKAVTLGRGRRVVALVGPTGVGKTTTIAKLAARFALVEKRRVALITVDTYRVGAVGQLQSYADTAGIPLAVAANPVELRQALEGFIDRDLVLIDTAGRSHRDELRMSELKEIIEAAAPNEVHLTLSAGSRYADAMEIMDRYAPLGFQRVIFTKLDETPRHGVIINLAVAAQRPLSYITTGQRVPEDISIASGDEIATSVMRPGVALPGGRAGA